MEPPLPTRLKLYNASNFFDRRAVPQQDVPRLAELARPFAAITVESHASTIGPLTLEFRALLSGRLEVAVGLETIHPIAIEHLNKRLELSRFDHAADFLARHDIELRVFVLLGAPYVPAGETVEWTARAAEYASRTRRHAYRHHPGARWQWRARATPGSWRIRPTHAGTIGVRTRRMPGDQIGCGDRGSLGYRATARL